VSSRSDASDPRPVSRPAGASDPGAGESAPDGESDAGELYSIGGAFGGASGLLDTGLPGVAFVVAYTASGQDMRLAVILALTCAGLLTVLRLVRRQSLQHAIAGFLGVAVAAYIASRTGRPEDFFLPGLLINAAYALAYAVSILVRWPLIGIVVAGFQQTSLTAWRRDPVLLRAYSRASWIWVAMFLVRLAVQLPLYLVGEDALVALGIARVAMGWPVFLVAIWLSYLVIKRTVPSGHRVRTERPRDEAGSEPAAEAANVEPTRP
jgi:hypothetical protein